MDQQSFARPYLADQLGGHQLLVPLLIPAPGVVVTGSVDHGKRYGDIAAGDAARYQLAGVD
jgi:hypothetical protein